jgi:hypothetical protein
MTHPIPINSNALNDHPTTISRPRITHLSQSIHDCNVIKQREGADMSPHFVFSCLLPVHDRKLQRTFHPRMFDLGSSDAARLQAPVNVTAYYYK